MHVLIVGPVQVGKSTLIRKILAALGRPVCGFETKKEDWLIGADGSIPIYIYPAGGPYQQTEENRIGIRHKDGLIIFEKAFERFAAEGHCQPSSDDMVILMDEIGHMESRSRLFCNEILKALDGDQLVLAAVKDKDKPFLEQVRNHPKARCFYITEENRDHLEQEIWEFIRSQENVSGDQTESRKMDERTV